MLEPPVPGLVARAVAEARRVGFPLTQDEGTGVGYGAAWIASAMPGDATLITVGSDPDRVAVAARLFAGDARVR